MKRFWNYIFYFTWKALSWPDKYILKLVQSVIFYIFPFIKKYEKTANDSYSNVMGHQSLGINILFAHKIMLSTTSIILLNFIVLFVYYLDFSFVEFVEPWFGKWDKVYNVYVSIIFILILSTLINEKLLGWHQDKYIKFFNEFAIKNNRMKGYCIMSLFHLIPIILLIFLIFYFDLYQR